MTIIQYLYAPSKRHTSLNQQNKEGVIWRDTLHLRAHNCGKAVGVSSARKQAQDVCMANAIYTCAADGESRHLHSDWCISAFLRYVCTSAIHFCISALPLLHFCISAQCMIAVWISSLRAQPKRNSHQEMRLLGRLCDYIYIYIYIYIHTYIYIYTQRIIYYVKYNISYMTYNI